MECETCHGTFKGRSDRLYCSSACANRAKHRRVRLREREIIAAEKLSRGCCVCGLMGPAYVLEFHHVDASTKAFEMGDARSVGNDRLRAEIAKCAVLCAVHHRMVEAGDLEI